MGPRWWVGAGLRERQGLLQQLHHRNPTVPESVTCTAVLPTSRSTVQHIAALLLQHRLVLGTRTGRRVLGCVAQAVLTCRFLLDATRVDQLARDNAMGTSTTYRYVHEALDVIAAQAPRLHPSLLAAHAAGHSHVNLDGTLIATNRVAVQGPTKGVGLWWSGKHHKHGGNIQVLTAPDGWPIRASGVRPGREHDIACARTHADLLDALVEFADAGHTVMADLDYEGERTRLTCPHKLSKDRDLDVVERTLNRVHAHVRARAEQGNAWLKNYRAMWRVTLHPQRIGAIAAAVLILLHLEHDRTTWPSVTIKPLQRSGHWVLQASTRRAPSSSRSRAAFWKQRTCSSWVSRLRMLLNTT